MITYEISSIVIFQCWLIYFIIYCIIIVIAMCLFFKTFKNNFSDNEKAFYSLCWPLAIVLCPIIYLIKKIKLNIKTKETSKLEEYRHKKETVYTVLKELKLR